MFFTKVNKLTSISQSRALQASIDCNLLELESS